MVRTLPQGSWLSGTPKLKAPWLTALFFFFSQGPWFIGFPYFVGSPKLMPCFCSFPFKLHCAIYLRPWLVGPCPTPKGAGLPDLWVCTWAC